VLASVLRNSPVLSSRGPVQSVARACRFCAQDLLPRMAQTRFKKPKKRKNEQLDFFTEGSNRASGPTEHLVREAKKRPL
jgi:hypothetical protein